MENAGVAPAEVAPVQPMDVSVVLPCLNEAESIQPCIAEALAAFERAGYAGEVVIADNGSTDGSRQLALDAGARVVDQPVRGYGAALRAGIEAARGEIVVMADADLTYPLDKLAEVVEPVRRGEVDLMLGGRLDAATRRSMPFLHRWLGTPVITFLVRRACGGLSISDSQSGYRAFKRAQMLDVGLSSDGMEFASEMLIESSRAGLRVSEVQTGYRERVGESKLNTFSDGWRHLSLILQLAPHIVLVWPGAALAVVGALFAIAGIAWPNGIEVGGGMWQPVFFSTIALVLGVQGLLAGMLIAERSRLVSDTVRSHYRFVHEPTFGRRCAQLGALALLAGLAIDLVLLVRGVLDQAPLAAALGLAAVAQALIILGASMLVFGMVFRTLVTQHQRKRRQMVRVTQVSAPALVRLDGRTSVEAALGD